MFSVSIIFVLSSIGMMNEKKSTRNTNSSNINFNSLLIPCICGEKINVTIYDILGSNEVKCPHCNASLKADYEKNEESIKLLQLFIQRIASIK